MKNVDFLSGLNKSKSKKIIFAKLYKYFECKTKDEKDELRHSIQKCDASTLQKQISLISAMVQTGWFEEEKVKENFVNGFYSDVKFPTLEQANKTLSKK